MVSVSETAIKRQDGAAGGGTTPPPPHPPPHPPPADAVHQRQTAPAGRPSISARQKVNTHSPSILDEKPTSNQTWNKKGNQTRLREKIVAKRNNNNNNNNNNKNSDVESGFRRTFVSRCNRFPLRVFVSFLESHFHGPSFSSLFIHFRVIL